MWRIDFGAPVQRPEEMVKASEPRPLRLSTPQLEALQDSARGALCRRCCGWGWLRDGSRRLEGHDSCTIYTLARLGLVQLDNMAEPWKAETAEITDAGRAFLGKD